MSKREGLMDLVEIGKDDLKKNYECIEHGKSYDTSEPQSIVWFLPIVTHALKGGVRTVFASAEQMTIKHGTLNTFIIYSYNGKDFDIDQLSESLSLHFPSLKFIVLKFLHGRDSVDIIPRSDIAVCTLWTTAYVMLKYNRTFRKFYFMQDFEPMFYTGGAMYMLIEQTYRLGYSCIANTPGVGNRYLKYNPDMTYFLPGVDRDLYHPLPVEQEKNRNGHEWQIVFYGRPNNIRNAFYLGIDVLKNIKEILGESVRILSVGAEWSEKEYGVDGVIENLGLLKKIEDVADLYRNSDVGLVFMATPHPSYQPLEYMASGCLVATNKNEENSWLLNEENSLLLDPIAAVAAEEIIACMKDRASLESKVRKGLETVEELNWTAAYDVIEKRMIGQCSHSKTMICSEMYSDNSK